MTTRTSTIEAIAKAWNASGLRYAVVGGIEDHPREVGRDLDVLVAGSDTGTLLQMAEDVLVAHGWRTVRSDDRDEPKVYGLLGAEAVEIHAVTKIVWAGVEIADAPRPATSVGPFQVDPWASFAKRLLLPLLRGDTDKVRQRWALLTEPDEDPALQAGLASLLGERGAARVRALLRERRFGAARSELRRGSIRRMCRRPRAATRLLARRIGRRAEAYRRPRGLVVALVGPDGVGKSSVMRSLERGSHAIFTGFTFRHWRPGLLPNLGTLLGRGDAGPAEGESLPPRRDAGRFAGIRLAYYALDYLLGHYLLDRMILAHTRVVFYDRHALDMMVDPLRYGLAPSSRGLHRVAGVPDPDLVILLRDTPERIHGRKPELPPEEIARQFLAWESLEKAGEVDAVIDVSGPPDEVAERVLALTLAAFERARTRAVEASVGREPAAGGST